MTEPSDILFVPQLAAKLGRTEAAIRSAVNRGADWLPPRMATRRLQWFRPTVDAFLQSLATPKKPAAKKRHAKKASSAQVRP